MYNSLKEEIDDLFFCMSDQRESWWKIRSAYTYIYNVDYSILGLQEIREVLLELRDRNRVIIIACHDREELETLSDEIIELYEGNITKKMHQSI